MQIEVAPRSTEVKISWKDARMYCFTLGDDWRLPTLEELQYLKSIKKLYGFKHSWYLTCTESSKIEGNYKIYHMGGIVGSAGRDSQYYVRAVRDKKG